MKITGCDNLTHGYRGKGFSKKYLANWIQQYMRKIISWQVGFMLEMQDQLNIANLSHWWIQWEKLCGYLNRCKNWNIYEKTFSKFRTEGNYFIPINGNYKKYLQQTSCLTAKHWSFSLQYQEKDKSCSLFFIPCCTES